MERKSVSLDDFTLNTKNTQQPIQTQHKTNIPKIKTQQTTENTIKEQPYNNQRYNQTKKRRREEARSRGRSPEDHKRQTGHQQRNARKRTNTNQQ